MTTAAHDRPDPIELLDAVAEFLAAAPADADRDRLHRRVAANVVALVARQLGSRSQDDADHAALLARFGVPDDEALARLAATSEDPALTAALRCWAEAKVRVVNPRYLAPERSA